MAASDMAEAPHAHDRAVGKAPNIDEWVVEGFGQEWGAYDQSDLPEEDYERWFSAYFSTFPFERLGDAEGFDLGCGSGRWALGVVERVGILHCIDPAAEALAVAKRRLKDKAGARFHLAGAHEIPLPDESQDFGYSLGVLHHIPDTEVAMRDCVAKLKPGAPFLVYLYYSFDNQPRWYQLLWRLTDVVRRGISRFPFGLRKAVAVGIATVVYFPLARTARLLELTGMNVKSFPLSVYRTSSFYAMRTDALDRFGTRLEQRFSRSQIEAMMARCGLTEIRFGEHVPYWVACGLKAPKAGSVLSHPDEAASGSNVR